MRNVFFGDEIQPPKAKRSRPLLLTHQYSASNIRDSPQEVVAKAPNVEVPKVISKRPDLTFKTNWSISANKMITDISSIKCAPCPRVSFSRGSGRLITFHNLTVLIHSLDLISVGSNAAEIKRIETQFENHTLITSHASKLAFANTRQKTNNPLNNSMLERLVVALYG